ncbi:MAG: phosphatidate cytidylyltransferase [Saprospirales bacterium]|nr:MAG: phosphatidate cytidylyltransferase [Saprospirales bacterium]
MIQTIYLIILGYFILGGVGFYLINRNRDRDTAKKSYTKYFTYVVIIHVLFFGIVLKPIVFSALSAGIVMVGLYELLKLRTLNPDKSRSAFFSRAIVVYLLVSAGFIIFGTLSRELVLFSFLVISIFDSFSQISGQLFGKTRISPNISPNKTLGGVVGGAIIAGFSAFLLSGLVDSRHLELAILSAGILVFAFFGDLGASLYKRKFGVKDFSKILPGHGGVLDRFDSLIAGGAWVVLASRLLELY